MARPGCRPRARVADRGVGEFLDADVDQHVALHPLVDRPDQRLAHFGEVEAVEMVEIDGVVAVDIAERLVDEDRVAAPSLPSFSAPTSTV